MQTYNIHYAKTNLSRLIEQILKGEELIIAKAGKPVAKLTAYKTISKKRKLGKFKGEIRIAKDFDAESEEINKLFYDNL